MKNDRHNRCAYRRDELFIQSPTRREVLRLAGAAGVGVIAPNLFLGCAGGSGTSAPVYEATIARMRTFIEKTRADGGIPAVSIALIDAEKEGAARVVWAEGFGDADREQQLKATSKTVYCIGSVSKALGAALALKQVDEGKLTLDEPVATYIPGFTMLERYLGIELTKQLTIRRLLNHHGGVPGDLNNGLFVHTSPYYGKYIDWLLGYLATNYPSHPPGAFASYSNTGVVLAAHASYLRGKTAADADYQSFMKRALFDPLGMSASTTDAVGKTVPELAMSYNVTPASRVAGTAWTYAPFPTISANAPATGGVYSTVEDMAKFLIMLLSDGVAENGTSYLRSATLQEMSRRSDTAIDFGVHTGLGLDDTSMSDFQSVAPDKDGIGRAWDKNGSTGTFNAQLMALPDAGLKLGVVVLTNSDTASNAVRTVAHEALSEAVKEKLGLSEIKRAPSPDYAGAITDPAGIVGTYSSGGGYFKVAQGAAGLTWEGKALTQNADGSGKFAVQNSGTEVVFMDRKDLYGNDYRLMVKVGGAVQGERLAKPIDVTSAWHARTTTSWLLEDSFSLSLGMGAWLNLVEENGMLLVKNQDGKQLLFPQSATFAFVGGYSNRKGSTVTAFDDGGRPRLEYSAEVFFPVDEVVVHTPGTPETITFASRGLQPFTAWRRITMETMNPNLGKTLKLRVSADDAGSVYYLLGPDEDTGNIMPVAVSYGAGGISLKLTEGTWFFAFVPSIDVTGTATLSSQFQ